MANSLPTVEPIAPPINMVGPSRPPAPPLPRVKMLASIFTGIRRVGRVPLRW